MAHLRTRRDAHTLVSAVGPNGSQKTFPGWRLPLLLRAAARVLRTAHGNRHRDGDANTKPASHIRSSLRHATSLRNTTATGQVRFITRPKSRTMRARRQLVPPPKVTSLESSYARRIRDDTAEPTTNVAENHNDVLQAANLFIREEEGSQGRVPTETTVVGYPQWTLQSRSLVVIVEVNFGQTSRSDLTQQLPQLNAGVLT